MSDIHRNCSTREQSSWCAIFTVAGLEDFRGCFSAKGIDVGAAIAHQQLIVHDADETLQRFMRDGVPMAQPFADTIGPIFAAAAARYPGASIRAYGEMVDVLWRQGQTAAAIRLEALWNDLARSHEFNLLCGYAMGSFYKGSATEEICSLHSHVVTDDGAHIALS